ARRGRHRPQWSLGRVAVFRREKRARRPAFSPKERRQTMSTTAGFCDLTGRRFGRLTVQGPDAGNHRRARRWWLCVCACEGRARRGYRHGPGRISVDTSSLLNGKVQSCGCGQGGGRSNAGRFSKKKVRSADERKERFREDGKTWLRPGPARRYLGVSYLTLQTWGVSCPWLGGKGIETRPFRGPFGKKFTCYAKSDLDAIRKERAKRDRVPQYPK